jgi:hypothetical protein
MCLLLTTVVNLNEIMSTISKKNEIMSTISKNKKINSRNETKAQYTKARCVFFFFFLKIKVSDFEY